MVNHPNRGSRFSLVLNELDRTGQHTVKRIVSRHRTREAAASALSRLPDAELANAEIVEREGAITPHRTGRLLREGWGVNGVCYSLYERGVLRQEESEDQRRFFDHDACGLEKIRDIIEDAERREVVDGFVVTQLLREHLGHSL